MKASFVLATILAAISLAACAGPGPSGPARPSYGSASFGSTSYPYGGDYSREARLTSPGRKVTLDTLPGMSGSALTATLGAPQFRRQDGQAEIWQYRGTACTLDVFLYADGNDLRVRYVDARGREEAQAKNPAEARACASALIESRAAGAG